MHSTFPTLISTDFFLEKLNESQLTCFWNWFRTVTLIMVSTAKKHDTMIHRWSIDEISFSIADKSLRVTEECEEMSLRTFSFVYLRITPNADDFARSSQQFLQFLRCRFYDGKTSLKFELEKSRASQKRSSKSRRCNNVRFCNRN